MATTASRPVLDERLLAAVGSIRAWGEARDWRGYDPYDGLSSPLAGALTLGSPVGRRLLTQGVKLSPLNLRPLLGIRPAWNAKALGLVASGYARLAAAADDAGARDQATRWLDWLAEHHAGDGGGHAWGYHFPVETRFFGYPSGAPNTIATSFVAQAFLDGYELLGEPGRLETAASAARFLEQRLLTRDRGRPYFRYLAGHDDLVHNANVLACAVLARTSRLAGEPLPALVDAALAVTLAAQRADGSWPYAAGPAGGWVDNFHTAYVLEALAECEHAGADVGDAVARGGAYWQRELFLADGTPKYTPARTYPLDSHNYAQAIETWCALGEADAARREARLLVERMLDRHGHVHFQRRRFVTSRVPFVRWTTAPAFRALARLLLEERSDARLG